MEVTSASDEKPFLGILLSVFYINPHRSKLIIAGLNAEEDFTSFVKLTSSVNGFGVILSISEWLQFLAELKIWITYAFIIDTRDTSQKELDNHIMFVEENVHGKYIGLKSTINRNFGVILSELTNCREILKQSRAVTLTIAYIDGLSCSIKSKYDEIIKSIINSYLKTEYDENSCIGELIELAKVAINIENNPDISFQKAFIELDGDFMVKQIRSEISKKL